MPFLNFALSVLFPSFFFLLFVLSFVSSFVCSAGFKFFLLFFFFVSGAWVFILKHWTYARMIVYYGGLDLFTIQTYQS